MEEKKPCPACGTPILAEAVKCRHCGRMLEEPAAPPSPPPRLVDRDAEHLRLLSITYYVLAGIKALLGCFPLIHVAIGIFVVAAGDSLADGSTQGPPPAILGWIFIAIGGIFTVVGWTAAILMFLCARRLARRRSHLFCMVVAGLSCLFFPFGTVAGVFTFVVLTRPSVRELFEGAGNRPAA